MQQPSVLIIDDSEIERYMLRHQLKKIGVSHILEQSNASAALKYLADYSQSQQKDGHHFPPDIIILDVNMPVMGGFEFLQKFSELTAQLDFARCHILMYSGSDEPQEKSEAMEYEFVKGYLVKGESDIHELKAMIKQL